MCSFSKIRREVHICPLAVDEQLRIRQSERSPNFEAASMSSQIV